MSRFSNFPGTSGGMACRYRKSTPKILARAHISKKTLATPRFSSFCRRIAPARILLREVVEAYRKVVAVLPRFQVEAGRDLNYKVCYPRGSFDRQSIAWDLNYFKYYFLRLAGIPFNEQALEDDFSRLTKFLLSAPHDYFLYRDFQSRNIMLRDGQPFFLDYQGGRKGALQYDIASLLYDAKADLPPELRQQLLDHYLDTLAGFIELDRDAFMQHYYAYVYVRIMQALGAYGFRGFYERKAHFLQSVPYALKNLRWLLHNVELPIALPTLMDAFNSMLASEKLQSLASDAGESGGAGFSAFRFTAAGRKMRPATAADLFSMRRSLPNPGREERFKALTGKDAPVIEYLNQQESVHQFLASVLSLVDASVSEYQRRGFKNLMVSFGCTGGQHRSVYLAEQLAKHLRGTERSRSDAAASSNWRQLERPDEGDDSGCWPGHAPAPAYRRPPQGAGGSRRTHAAGDHAFSPAQLRHPRRDHQRASLCRHGCWSI